MAAEKVFIVSNHYDISPNKVIDWLISFNKEVIRVGQEDLLIINGIILNNQDLKIDFLINGKNYKEKSTSFWYRNGDIHIGYNVEEGIAPVCQEKFYRNETKTLKRTIYEILKGDVFINSFYKEIDNSKYLDSIVANRVGLNIPETLIASSPNQIVSFIAKHKKIVAKPIKDIISVKADEKHFQVKNHILTEKDIDSILGKGSYLYPCLYQEYIEKMYEIRVFVFQERIFPMAIFSQQNEKTTLDFRNYDLEKPNRCVPYSFSENMTTKILNFCKESQLDSCSMDLIYSVDEEYFFIESNPSGQFDWLSANCNYNVEKIIAQCLIKN